MDSVKTAVDLANQRNTSQGIQDNNIRTPQASQQQLPTRHRQLDKPIILKRHANRSQIHRYDIRIKVKQSITEDIKQKDIHEGLQTLMNIMLQADPTTIIPPYLDLDRNNWTVPDLSAQLQVPSIDSFAQVNNTSQDYQKGMSKTMCTVLPF